ncbi:hypothetical protein ACFSQD_12735 [Flavihumibacter stibioxidans]|uniref:G/U mismatch-specific uracil-DNA glycosylase n=1 Tax=Flavihumibacter stibioxidans TaxID=1834163 RepID=A0ABR7MAA2_9BACT|nr:hypothetical protein [Flavihumibacter stibioxidans]MBC6491541.1 hypothetical protein [Flavihumibacter stibioxidans]
MPCTHQFFRHEQHLPGEKGLLPAWPIQTLIIGTFNPEKAWAEKNTARYFYGRERNLLWNVLPEFAGEPPVPKSSVEEQIALLKRHQIGLTDLLIRIEDADLGNAEHRRRIATFLDKDLEQFSSFTWNTPYILELLAAGGVEAVYFTRLGKPQQARPRENSFEQQMRIIEAYCHTAGIPVFRLHTPTGQGMGPGSPRKNRLIQKWYRENGGKDFPFLAKGFDPNKYPVKYTEAGSR